MCILTLNNKETLKVYITFGVKTVDVLGFESCFGAGTSGEFRVGLRAQAFMLYIAAFMDRPRHKPVISQICRITSRKKRIVMFRWRKLQVK